MCLWKFIFFKYTVMNTYYFSNKNQNSMLGTALPGFRDCNPSWLRLSERPWDAKPLRRQSLSPCQEPHLCPLYFTLLGPQCMTGLPMKGKIPQGRNDLRHAWSWKRPTGKDSGGNGGRGWWTLASQFWHGLSPHFVCKKSSNLLAALLPWLDLSLKQCWRWVRTCAGKRWFPGAIRPEKECKKPEKPALIILSI